MRGLFASSFLAPHHQVMRKAFPIEVPCLLSDGTATQGGTHAALKHAVSRFRHHTPVIASPWPFPTQLLASRPICPPNGDVLVPQRRNSFASKRDDELMEPLLRVKFRVRNNALVLHPRSGHLLKIIKTMSMAVLMDDSVFDSQTPCANRNRCLAVWLPQDVALCPLAIGDAWIGKLEVCGVYRHTFIPPAHPSKLHQLA